MQEKPERSNGELVEPIELELPSEEFMQGLHKRKDEAVTSILSEPELKIKEDHEDSLQGYPYRNTFIDGKLIKAAKQEIRGHKVVLVDPRGRVVHVLSNNPPKRKKKKTR